MTGIEQQKADREREARLDVAMADARWMAEWREHNEQARWPDNGERRDPEER